MGAGDAGFAIDSARWKCESTELADEFLSCPVKERSTMLGVGSYSFYFYYY